MSRANLFTRTLLLSAGPALLLTFILYFWLHLDLLASWLLAINLAAFLTYAYDKIQAQRAEGLSGKHRVSRVPEKALLALTALGGCFGAFLSMRLFRHKTAKTEFQVVFWLIASAEIILVAVYLLFSGRQGFVQWLP
jgi:uncharacterized membrane protein YsdA (DUF1294 family)